MQNFLKKTPRNWRRRRWIYAQLKVYFRPLDRNILHQFDDGNRIWKKKNSQKYGQKTEKMKKVRIKWESFSIQCKDVGIHAKIRIKSQIEWCWRETNEETRWNKSKNEWKREKNLKKAIHFRNTYDLLMRLLHAVKRVLNWCGVDEDDIRTHTHKYMQMQNTHQQRQTDNGSSKRKRMVKTPVDNIALLCLFALNDFRSEAQRVCVISCCVYLSLRVFGFVLMLLTWKLSIENVRKNESDAKKQIHMNLKRQVMRSMANRK